MPFSAYSFVARQKSKAASGVATPRPCGLLIRIQCIETDLCRLHGADSAVGNLAVILIHTDVTEKT